MAHMAVAFDEPEPAESFETGLGAVDVDRGTFRLVLAILLSFGLTGALVIGGSAFIVMRIAKWFGSFWQ